MTSRPRTAVALAEVARRVEVVREEVAEVARRAVTAEVLQVVEEEVLQAVVGECVSPRESAQQKDCD